MAIKINDAEHYESVMIHITEENFPIVFKNKLEELMECKAFDSEEEARKWIEETPIEVELYYEKGYGLFGVEAEAMEACGTDFASPYTKEPFEE